MAGWRRWAHLSLVLSAVVVVYFIAPVSSELHRATVVRILLSVLVLGLLVAGVVRQLRLHLDDQDRRVDGLIVSIVVVMTAFSFCYYALQQRDPSQFVELKTRLDALYFTATTASSVGFGDVHAAGQVARGMVLVQIVFNVVFIGTAVALLSSRIRAVANARAEARASGHGSA